MTYLTLAIMSWITLGSYLENNIFLFQSCLTTIYWSFLSGNNKSLEGLVGCVLGFVQVPPSGGPKMTFSMGAGDRQTLSPPTSETLPVTGKSVSILFNQLGEFYM